MRLMQEMKQMMVARRAWRSILGISMVCGLLVAVVVAIIPHERLLLQRATRICSTRTWRPVIPSLPDRVSYAWLSNHQLLYFEGTGNGSRVVRLNVRTGAEQPVPGVHGLLTIPGNGWLISLSPDRQWFLWKRWWKFPTFREAVYATRVDGSRTVTWPGAVEDTSTWLADSRAWLDIVVLSRNGAKPPTGPPIGQIFGVDGSSPQPVRLTGLQRPAWILGLLSPGRGLVAANSGGLVPGQDTFDLTEFGIGAENGRLRSYRILVPPNTLDGVVLLSPHGDRLLWLLQRERPPLGIGALGEWAASALHHPTPQADELWVSRVDGRDLHRLGRTPYRNGNRGPYLLSLQWLPDGKRVSFVYNHALYVMPVD